MEGRREGQGGYFKAGYLQAGLEAEEFLALVGREIKVTRLVHLQGQCQSTGSFQKPYKCTFNSAIIPA